MALDATKLATVFAGVQQVHVYNSGDAPATVAGSGYFNAVTDRLKQWDLILVSGTTGGTPTFDLLGVTSATGAATVTTTNGT